MAANAHESAGAAAAIPLLQRAIEIDPGFAMAYAWLAQDYGEIGETDLSAQYAGKAYQLRDRASDREKFFIAVNYDVNVIGNLEKAQQICELWKQTYPRDGRAHTHLSGMIYPAFGKYEKAVEEARIAIGIEPDFPIGYNILTESYTSLDRLGDAENTLQQASERKLEIPNFLVKRYEIAFLKDDHAGMERMAALSREKSGAEDWLSGQEALALVYSGHLREAKAMSQHAADIALQASKRESAALYETEAAMWEALFGDGPEAKRSATAALELSKGLDVEYGAAFALALAGDSSRSQILASDLERRFPEDTSVRFSYLPTLGALLALNRGETSKAIELLQAAVPNELGEPRSLGALYPVYVRGEAYRAAHKGAEAAAESQKILDHRGIVVSDPIGALAHLQLGRALALSGDKIKAKTAYQGFLTLWKDADANIPILDQAHKEYATLQ
jgi:tetratricopeptide (TPR) repeat protein